MKTACRDDISYYYSKDLEPILRVRPGEMLKVETQDCFSARLQGGVDATPDLMKWIDEHYNPVTGPIFVEGAEAGDTLHVTIHSMECGPTASVIVPSQLENLGDLNWSEVEVINLPVDRDRIVVGQGISIEVEPVIGCIATAPAQGRHSTLTGKGPYGGNLDCVAIGSGAKVSLPVFADGGLLFFGDGHAIQSEGEILCPPEVPTTLTISVDITKRRQIEWPRVETDGAIMSVAAAPSFEEASQRATSELLAWLEDEFRINSTKAAVLLGMVGDVRAGCVGSGLSTAVCQIARKHLAEKAT